MSENSVSRGSINRTVGSEIKFAGSESKDKMYEPKHKRKIIRVLTVIAYVFSVSLAAIMLSLFYIFIYNPAKTAVENGKSQGTSESVNLVVQSSVQKIADASINSTLEREEPKVLPLEDLKYPFREKRNIETRPLKKTSGASDKVKGERTLASRIKSTINILERSKVKNTKELKGYETRSPPTIYPIWSRPNQWQKQEAIPRQSKKRRIPNG